MVTANNSVMTFRTLALALALIACRNATSKQPDPAAGSATGSGSAMEVAATVDAGVLATSDYVPAEFKAGMSRFKDVGVYVDGKPIGFLSFGELPITLKPTWLKDKVSQNKSADCPECPAWKWAQKRVYKFTDYLKAMNIDVHQIKEMHVYGPKLSQSIVTTGADLLSPAANEYFFRFGSDVAGKALPHVPHNFGNRKQPDKITSVMIYIKKKPPAITRDGVALDGVEQEGVPYYGEPLRGGVRVYLDDRLATIIKRQELDVKTATKTPDGDLHWSFAQFLSSKGVETSKLVEGWVIRDDRRKERIPWSELKAMSFSAGSQAKGGIFLGDNKLMANAIALHTRAITPDELPVVLPEEEP